jgi:predicted GNAT family acetyltransferase
MTSPEQEIVREDDGNKGRYVLNGPAGEQAMLTYTRVGEKRIIIDHTEVPHVFRGQGVGLKLLERAIGDARAEGRIIIPLCPFARSQFERHPEWADVLERKG